MVIGRRTRIKNVYAENQLFMVRSIVAGVIAGVLLIGVAGRLFYLQVLRHEYYSTLSQGNRIRNEPSPTCLTPAVNNYRRTLIRWCVTEPTTASQSPIKIDRRIGRLGAARRYC